MRAAVTVMLKDGVLDPQGKAIEHALHTLGFEGVRDVRAGKVIHFDVDAANAAEARGRAEDMARRLLANTVIESFKVEILP